MVRARDRSADAFQKGEVRHVAGPDLEYLGVLHDELYIARIEDFGDGFKPEFSRDFGEYLQALLAQTLEGVRGGTGLEGPAADVLVAGLLHGPGRGGELFVTLDGAGAGDDPEGVGAYHAVRGLDVGLSSLR